MADPVMPGFRPISERQTGESMGVRPAWYSRYGLLLRHSASEVAHPARDSGQRGIPSSLRGGAVADPLAGGK